MHRCAPADPGEGFGHEVRAVGWQPGAEWAGDGERRHVGRGERKLIGKRKRDHFGIDQVIPIGSHSGEPKRHSELRRSAHNGDG